MNKLRCDGRKWSDIRKVSVEYDAFGHSDASVLFSQGATKVFVAVTLQNGVPHFLKGQRKGWLTAEYSMLPTATHQRTQRESQLAQRNFRSVEISRLIGRCLRSVVDLSSLGEKSIIVDCDVLQADGGTRVACITAASLALELAMSRWVSKKIIRFSLMKHLLVALSVGYVNKEVCVDLCYQEDSQAEADFNIIATTKGDMIEVQGTAEKGPLSQDAFNELKEKGMSGIEVLVEALKPFSKENSSSFLLKDNHVRTETHKSRERVPLKNDKVPFFSLSSRLKQQ